MALATGNQLKAARALAGVDQQQLADSAGVNVNTIRNMEARGAAPITSGALTVRNVQMALEALGIEFLNHSRPGVRLSKSTELNSVAKSERATMKRAPKKRR
jgi:transcriptional regulator with XRE-family HTH domain